MMIRLIAATAMLLAAPAFAEDEPTEPSFDCTRALSEVEETVCKEDWLAWFDRQMTKAYGVAKAAPGVDAAALKAGQTAFLKTRNACKGDDENCIMLAYEHRLRALTKQTGNPRFTAGDYASDGGGVDAVTYPDGSAALNISIVMNAGQFTCSYTGDHATADAGGNITATSKPQPDSEDSCSLAVTPPDAKGHIKLSSSGQACSYYCGAAATLDGEFDRLRN